MYGAEQQKLRDISWTFWGTKYVYVAWNMSDQGPFHSCFMPLICTYILQFVPWNELQNSPEMKCPEMSRNEMSRSFCGSAPGIKQQLLNWGFVLHCILVRLIKTARTTALLSYHLTANTKLLFVFTALLCDFWATYCSESMCITEDIGRRICAYSRDSVLLVQSILCPLRIKYKYIVLYLR